MFGNQIFTNNLPSFSDKMETNALWISLRWDWKKKKAFRTLRLHLFRRVRILLSGYINLKSLTPKAITNPVVLSSLKVAKLPEGYTAYR